MFCLLGPIKQGGGSGGRHLGCMEPVPLRTTDKKTLWFCSCPGGLGSACPLLLLHEDLAHLLGPLAHLFARWQQECLFILSHLVPVPAGVFPSWREIRRLLAGARGLFQRPQGPTGVSRLLPELAAQPLWLQVPALDPLVARVTHTGQPSAQWLTCSPLPQSSKCPMWLRLEMERSAVLGLKGKPASPHRLLPTHRSNLWQAPLRHDSGAVLPGPRCFNSPNAPLQAWLPGPQKAMSSAPQGLGALISHTLAATGRFCSCSNSAVSAGHSFCSPHSGLELPLKMVWCQSGPEISVSMKPASSLCPLHVVITCATIPCHSTSPHPHYITACLVE